MLCVLHHHIFQSNMQLTFSIKQYNPDLTDDVFPHLIIGEIYVILGSTKDFTSL